MINASAGPSFSPTPSVPPATVSPVTPIASSDASKPPVRPHAEPVPQFKPLKSKSKFNFKLIGSILVLLVLVTGVVTAWYLQSRPQNIAPKADTAESCDWCAGADQCYGATGHAPVSGGVGACGGGTCCQGYHPATTGGGGGGGGGGNNNPPPNTSCPDYQKSKPDTGSVCTPGCCQPGNDSTCPSGQRCNIANGYCNSGTSCNSNPAGGTHKACDPAGSHQCINQPCAGNAATCNDDCLNDAACGAGGGGGGGGGGGSNLCSSSAPTAKYCQGVAVGTTIDNFCQCQSTTAPACACVPLNKLANGLSCTDNENCESNYCDPAAHVCKESATSGFTRTCYTNPTAGQACIAKDFSFATAALASAFRCPSDYPASAWPSQCSTGSNRPCYDQYCQVLQVANDDPNCPASHPFDRRPTTCAPIGGGGNGGGEVSIGGTCTNPGGATIGKFQKYVCDKCSFTTGSDGVQAWRCNTLVQESTTQVLHLAAGECGQVDQISTGGQFCGYTSTDYTCGNPACQGNPPASNPPASTSPTPTPPGPVCLAITMSNVTEPQLLAPADPKLGDAVRFTCGTVAGITKYAFQVVQPNGFKQTLAATGNTSAIYNITQPGKFFAQCQICTGTADSTCLPFEAYSNAQP